MLRFPHVGKETVHLLVYSALPICTSFGHATHLNALVLLSFTGGVPVREEAPESSGPRLSEPPGPRRRPLLLREPNIMEVGPSVTFELEARFAPPFKRRRSSMPTWFGAACGKPDG